MRTYTTADGLPSNQVSCNRKDSHGFLWFCTPEGLSRFDGYTFTNYGVDQGLPDRVVTDFLETKNGVYWVGTVRGVALFDPKPGTKSLLFTVFGKDQTGMVNALAEDVHGSVWIAATSGLFQLVPEDASWSFRRADVPDLQKRTPEDFLADHEGNLWISIYPEHGPSELWRRRPDGGTDIFRDPFFDSDNRITAITEDRQGRLWVSTYRGLGLAVPNPQSGRPFIQHVYADLNHPTREVAGVFESSDGRLWVGGHGTWEILTDADGQVHFRMFDPHGVGFDLEDQAGNLWMGNQKVERGGFVNFDVEDGLKTHDIRSIFEGSDGELYVVTGIHGRHLHRFDGDHFTAVSPLVPGHDADWDWGPSWGWGQINFQDHAGKWWIASGATLMRYPKVKRMEDLGTTPPEKIFTKPTGVFRLYEDSRGDIWIGAWGFPARERSSDQIGQNVSVVPTAFREDRSGNVWIGRWQGGLSRNRNGRDEWIIPPDAAVGSVLSILLDHAGRLWAGTTRRGLLRVDDPGALHPQIRTYSTREGLSSNDVRAITEDHFGRIYFWTGRSVDRLNPDTGAVRHYTEADGLIGTGADNNVAFCDRQGRLWFGLNGLSRLDPKPDRQSQPPPIRITELKISGVDYPVSELGEAELSGLELQPNENHIQIEFASLNFISGDVIRYQYKLEGADSDWSPPSDLRAVNYPRLPSGRYRFLVRAVNADGQVSAAPAIISMRLLPPIWTRWWFILTALSLAASAIYLAYRYRVRHLLELERVRTRIATDLHDDIGSSLTQIAIMSEVAQKQTAGQPATEPLVHIADLSRELVDSMSDIVWAINPKRDHLGDLTQRMRRFVSDVLEAAEIEVDFRAPHQSADATLSADVRREVFLIFKESVNNIVHHAKCRHVEVLVDV